MSRPRTYRQAGVDVALARRFIQAIQPLAAFTHRPGLLRGIGGFGGLFELKSPSGRPILVASADGVGTKLRLAKQACLNRWGGREASWLEPLGVDLVAMNVNDLICTGARPLFFLDYIACGRLDPSTLLGVIRGIVRGCREADCVLLGGETAQMPLIYRQGDFDLAGFAVGIVERRSLITGQEVRVGDRVLGLASSGPHANGFTLIQRLFPLKKLRKKSGPLLKPTRIYTRSVLGLLQRGIPIHGIAHITGGAFYEKIPRILPEGVGVRLRKGSWRVPAIFRWIQASGVSEAEMYRTFNCGIGMVVILPPPSVSKAQALLRRQDLESWTIGEVTRGRREVEII